MVARAGFPCLTPFLLCKGIHCLVHCGWDHRSDIIPGGSFGKLFKFYNALAL